MLKTKMDKQRVAQAFLKSVRSYDTEAVVQKEAAEALVTSCLHFCNKKHNRVLEIGCGSGLLCQKFTDCFDVDKYIVNDLNASFCEITQEKVADKSVNISSLVGDAEEITLPDKCDLILSSSTMQWFEDVDSFVKKTYSQLVDDGIFAFTMFSEGTMKELKALTQRGLNYVSARELYDSLARYYTVMSFEKYEKQLFFSAFGDIVRHMKQTGVNGLSGKRFTIPELRRVAREYEQCFRTKRGLPVSYHYILAVARRR